MATREKVILFIIKGFFKIFQALRYEIYKCFDLHPVSGIWYPASFSYLYPNLSATMSTTPTVVITGAAGGLGSALCKIYAQNAYRVFAGDLAFPEPSPHPLIHQQLLDVTSKESIIGFLDNVEEACDSLDLLVNNAGISENYPIAEEDPEATLKMFNINALGTVRMIHYFLPLLLKAKGRIITISSDSIAIPGAFQPYQSSKIALEGLHKALRQELLIKGIRMSSVRPGAIDTPLLRKVTENNPDKYLLFKKEFGKFRTIAPRFFGRIISPERVAYRIFRLSRKKHLPYVCRINHDPIRTLVGILPERFRDYLVMIRLTRF
jgi:NAD(P)-dependent dehydrogenase (short-subunit alcohol dehydrogenase family)